MSSGAAETVRPHGWNLAIVIVGLLLTGAVNYLRAMGSLVGTAVLGAIVTRSGAGALSGSIPLATRQALAMSLNQAFLVTLGVGVAILVLTLFLKDVRLRKRGEV